MSLYGLLAWIRAKRRDSTHPQDEPGVVISTRLKELFQVKDRKSAGAASTQPEIERMTKTR